MGLRKYLVFYGLSKGKLSTFTYQYDRDYKWVSHDHQGWCKIKASYGWGK